jgi:hypothetical protein
MFSNSQRKKNKGLLTDPELIVGGIESQLDIHQVEVSAVIKDETLTGGTIAFFAKGSAPNAQWQPVQKDGADYIMDVGTGVVAFDIPNSSITAIKGEPVDPLTASGGDLEWTLNIISGRKG